MCWWLWNFLIENKSEYALRDASRYFSKTFVFEKHATSALDFVTQSGLKTFHVASSSPSLR